MWQDVGGYLAGCKVHERVTIVRRTGWHDIGGRQVFVLPSRSVGAKEGEQVCLDGVGASAAYEERGTLGEWKVTVCGLAEGHILPMLAISAAFAGPLLFLGDFEGGGLHFVGPSSTGKSTLLQCAASVWGVGGTPGFVRTWRATANGLEGLAAASSDTALVLDELGQVEPRDAASALYSLANGAGKSRARRDGSLREPATWRCLVISSGEIPIETKLGEERGRAAQAGQLVRLVDVHVDRGLGCGAFDNGGPDGDPGQLAGRFKNAASKFCGVAGPEFVRRMLDRGTTREQLQTQVSGFMADHVPSASDGQVERAARKFGVIAVAGELATSLGITGWARGEPTSAAAWALTHWISSRGGIAPAEERQALERVRLILQRDGESRFEPLDADNPYPVNGRLGWRRGQGTEREWFISPEMWKLDICAGLDPKFVARTLAGLGMLERANDGFQPVRRIEGRNLRVYVLNNRVLEDIADE